MPPVLSPPRPQSPAPPGAVASPLRPPPGEPLWVFGYGSLMWRPGFPHDERRVGVLHGYHRAFCLYSWRHRGTPEVPGAVLGLDRGGACKGVAYRVPEVEVDTTLDYLWDREMLNYVYHPRRAIVRLVDGRRIEAATFVVDRSSDQYCGGLPLDDLVRLIRQGVGESGRAVDYLRDLAAHLKELRLRDRRIEALMRAVLADELAST